LSRLDNIMDISPFLIKLKLKAKHIEKQLHPPLKVLPLDKFYSSRWQGKAPSAGYFSERSAPHFYFKSQNLPNYHKALRANFPGVCHDITRRAISTVAHKFNFLGSSEVFLGDKIDWQIDFKSGGIWPAKPFAKLQLVDSHDNSDVKIPWELSRFQFVTDLGRAFWLNDNPVYKKEFMALLEDWEDSNPVDIGVNWTCSMEVAIRAINIIWGINYYYYNENETEFIRRAIRLLYYHGLHIEKNLEIVAVGANTNHLISDYLGLFYLGLLIPDFDRAEKWREIGRRGLEAEILAQVNSDGADYESSTSYHRLVLEMFLSAFILGRLNSIEFSDTFKKRLYRMIKFSEAISGPSGLAPLIGDNDDGFIVKISTNNPADHRPLIDIGLLMFGERIPSEIPMSEERLWYLGPDSLMPYKSFKLPESQLFKKSGYAVIKSSDFHLVFNAAGVPQGNFGGHKHNDLLSFTLEIDGIPYLVDPGTFCYSADFAMRNLSRSTLIHNTVTIDGREQNRFLPGKLFYLVRDSVPKIHLWTNLEKSAVVSATHNGYQRLDDGIIHKRTLSVSLYTSTVHIKDEFTGNSGNIHNYTLQFITPLRTVERIDDSIVTISKERFKSLIIKASSEKLADLQIESSEYFPHYGQKALANLIKYSYSGKLPFTIETIITHGGRVLTLEDQLRLAETDIKHRFGPGEEYR
jgi:hypothetical protein